MKSKCASYWERFLKVYQNTHEFWEEGTTILFNIDHRLTAQKMKHASDPLSKVMVEPEGDSTSLDHKDDANGKDNLGYTLILTHFDEDNERRVEENYCVMEGYQQAALRTNKHLVDRVDISTDKEIPA